VQGSGHKVLKEEQEMILMVTHRVRNFELWKPVFEEHQSVRERYGATGHLIYRSLEDPSLVTIIMQYPSEQRARAFLEDSSLQEAMHRAGVEGEPAISMWTETEGLEYTVRKAA